MNKYYFKPGQILICPVCKCGMGSVSVHTYFSAFCKNKHFSEGTIIHDVKNIMVVTSRKRLGNRRLKIIHYLTNDTYRLELVRKNKANPFTDDSLARIDMTAEEYKEYDNKTDKLKKKLEIAEVFG